MANSVTILKFAQKNSREAKNIKICLNKLMFVKNSTILPKQAYSFIYERSRIGKNWACSAFSNNQELFSDIEDFLFMSKEGFIGTAGAFSTLQS